MSEYDHYAFVSDYGQFVSAVGISNGPLVINRDRHVFNGLIDAIGDPPSDYRLLAQYILHNQAKNKKGEKLGIQIYMVVNFSC
jgi:hypothetical protein